MIKIGGGGAGVVTHLKPHPPGGHSITKHTGGWLEGLNQKPQTIYPKIALLKKMPKSYPLNILKVQSDSSKISNLGQTFIFTENCTPNYLYESF